MIGLQARLLPFFIWIACYASTVFVSLCASIVILYFLSIRRSACHSSPRNPQTSNSTSMLLCPSSPRAIPTLFAGTQWKTHNLQLENAMVFQMIEATVNWLFLPEAASTMRRPALCVAESTSGQLVPINPSQGQERDTEQCHPGNTRELTFRQAVQFSIIGIIVAIVVMDCRVVRRSHRPLIYDGLQISSASIHSLFHIQILREMSIPSRDARRTLLENAAHRKPALVSLVFREKDSRQTTSRVRRLFVVNPTTLCIQLAKFSRHMKLLVGLSLHQIGIFRYLEAAYEIYIFEVRFTCPTLYDYQCSIQIPPQMVSLPFDHVNEPLFSNRVVRSQPNVFEELSPSSHSLASQPHSIAPLPREITQAPWETYPAIFFSDSARFAMVVRHNDLRSGLNQALNQVVQRRVLVRPLEYPVMPFGG